MIVHKRIIIWLSVLPRLTSRVLCFWIHKISLVAPTELASSSSNERSHTTPKTNNLFKTKYIVIIGDIKTLIIHKSLSACCFQFCHLTHLFVHYTPPLNRTTCEHFASFNNNFYFRTGVTSCTQVKGKTCNYTWFTNQ